MISGFADIDVIMGAPNALNGDVEGERGSGMGRKTRGKSSYAASDANEADINTGIAINSQKKRKMPGDSEKVCAARKMPKRAAACSDFREKPLRLSDKSSVIETKRGILAEDEIAALHMTSVQDGPRPNRRLTNFIFHDSDGKPQPVEMLEVNDLFISGLILPLEGSSDKDKERGIRCEGFGRIESWAISGYEEGSPVIWVSTDAADYDCVKPANNYKKPFSLFFEKARACIEVYKKLRASGGNPDLSVDELLAGVARSMSGNKNFPHQMSIKDFIASQGEFIYNQLIGLDETSMKNDEIFRDLPVLVALRDEVNKYEGLEPANGTALGNVMDKSLRIGNGEQVNHSSSSSCFPEEDEDMKLARVLQEEENWQSKLKKNRGPIAQLNKFYIKINEDEIANDYPLPAYYTSFDEEADEFLIFDLDTDDPDHLPKSMLNNWTLYNSDSRLISLELLPMKPCADIDVTVFGSGLMMEDDGSGFNIDANTTQSASGSAGVQNADGMPIYLSAIKEWTIEYGHGMIFIFIRTDLAWYRLGKPSKQYAPWYKPVLKAARLTVSLITLLEEQIRSSRISFDNVVRKISEFDKDHPAFISSNLAAVERYLVVHGPIILQQLSEYPGPIKNCAFVTALRNKMEERHHTKWLVKKKAQLKTEVNMNPRASMTPTVSKRKAMPATTTRLINGIWGEFYSNYSPEDTKEVASPDVKETDEVEDEQEEVEDDSEEVGEEIIQLDEEMEKPQCSLKLTKLQCADQDLRWNGESVGKTSAGGALYMQAIVHGDRVAVGNTVLVETVDSENFPIYFVEYMFENSDARKMIHGRLMLRGSQTVLGKAGNEREVFLTNDCLEFELDDIKQTVVMETQAIPWGYQHRKANALKDKTDRERHEDRKRKGLPTEFFCKSFYCPERGAFFCLPNGTMGLGTGLCHSCKMKESQREKEMFKLNMPGFSFNGIEYHIQDFVYLGPCHLAADDREHETFKSGRNVGLSAYVVGQLIDIEVPKGSRLASPESTNVKVRRFFRPEDVSPEKSYCSDIREVYYSDQILTVPIVAIEGKCDVQKKNELPLVDGPTIVEHVFYCEHLYDPDTGAVRQLPANIKLNLSKEKVVHEAVSRKKKGKCKENENDIDNEEKASNTFCMDRLATLDIFAGCGGLSEGLQKAGASITKWAIEYEEPAGEAFKLNHPEAFMFIHNCNVILRAIMESSGDADDCVSTSEAAELAAKLDESMIKNLPRPGEVDFINGGPPCQGFSGMNRFNQSSWSKVQCEMILAFLSFVDYFRPKFFLLENVRNFVSFNKGQTFRLTLASLLAIGYQVRFGVLEAGAYGVAQSRKRAFIWAAAPSENLPEWPEPMHVFASPELKIALSGSTHYAAVRSTVNGAPFRSITVKDTIGDLPVVDNGASKTTMEYGTKPESWFQKVIRGDSMALTDHVSKEMNELNLIRCKRIPRRPGADWRDLPDEKVKLSTGQVVDLIPWCLPNTAKRHNQWKGLFGRLDWKGNFPTSVTDPQPMGKVGMCFHPEQDRIVTVRECARSQGFPDTYKFAGNMQHKHRQIGNAVPPPLAYALGRKLKEAVENKGSK